MNGEWGKWVTECVTHESTSQPKADPGKTDAFVFACRNYVNTHTGTHLIFTDK